MKPITFDEIKKLDWQPFTISPGCKTENNGYFTNLRVDKKTIPSDWYAYDIRSNENGSIAYIEKDDVIVNHAGTFFTQKPIKFNKKGVHCLNHGAGYTF